MNEILLAFVTFSLGVLATVITQYLNRKVKLQEQRRQRSAERLADIEKWLIYYRRLFQCKYPQLQELVLVHRYIDPNFGVVKLGSDGKLILLQQNKEAFENIRNALIEYKAVESKYKEIEKSAIFALRALGANTNRPNLFTFPFYYLQGLFFRRSAVYFIGESFTLWFPQGFVKDIAPHLSEIKKQKDELFHSIPSSVFYHLDWELLDNIKFEQFSKLLIPIYHKKNFPALPTSADEVSDFLARFSIAESYTEEEIQLLETLSVMERCRVNANNAIDDALLVIEQYKTEWL